MFKKISSLFICALLSTAAFSQVSVGAYFSSVNFLSGSEVSNTGFGLVGNYGLDNGIVAFGGIGLYSAYELEGEFTATAASNQTSPSSIKVGYTNEIPLTHVFVGAKKYFVGDYDDENFGFYGSAQLGYMASSYSTTIDDYDDVNYNLSVAEDETVSNFMLGVGVGVEKGIGDLGFVFGQAKFNLTSNEENGVAVEVEIPASTEINIGYRYLF